MLVLLFLITETMAFTGKAIFSNPSTVQTPNVAIEFYAVPETTVNVQGTIQLTAPSSITVHQPSSCYDVLNKIACTVSLQAKTFTITTSAKLMQSQQFQFRLGSAIDNPISTQPTNSWSLLTSSGESLQSDMQLTATPGVSSLTLQPVSTVVGASTNVVIKWTCVHAIPQGSIFQFSFPIWNPKSPSISQQLPFFQGGVVCSPLVVLSSKLTCSFSNNTLTVSSSVSSDIGPKTDLAIMVTGFKNPMDTSEIKGFTVTSMYQNYLIDVGSGVLQVTDYAQITNGKLEVRYPDAVNAGVIQNTEDMKLSFYLPVPLNQGCQVTVVLPKQYSVTTVSAVSALQLFGSYTQFTGSNLLISQQNNSFTFYPCDSYKTNQNQAVIYISQLTQYKYEMLTDSAQVYITNAGYKICQVQSGVSFLPSRGVADVTSVASNPQINKPTSLWFSLLPKHKIYAADMPSILISFPTTVTGCSVSIGSCLRDQQNANLVTIKGVITKDYSPGDPAISFNFTSVINPSTTKPMESFDLQILAVGRYVIDESTGTTPWTLQPGNMSSVFVNPGSYQANKPNNNYIIQFTHDDYLPLNAYFEITFPDEILVPDLSFSASACSANQGLTVTCSFLNSTRTVLRVFNAFRIIPGQTGTIYQLTIPGVQNPIRTSATGPFIIKSLTSDDYVIDQFVGANIQMLIEAQILKITLQPSNYINSKLTTYQIHITPSVPVTNNNLVLLTFPDQMTLPKSDLSYDCSTTYSNLIQQVACKTYSRNTVMVSFMFVGRGVASSDTFGFSISGITNPPSTQTTDSLQFRIVDRSTFATTNQMLFGVTVTTSLPSPIANASVSLDTYQPGVPAAYTFQFVPEHVVNAGGGILITVPPQVSFEGQIAIFVTIQNQQTDQQLIYTQVTQSARQILIQNAIQSYTKDVITVKIQGLNTPFSNQPTDSFQIRTFNQVNGLYYFIDAVVQGLQISAICSYPCNTCLANQPSVCTSCFQQSSGIGLPFLQLGTCVSECNFGRYYNAQSQQCELCDSSCLTCVNTATQCTTCGNNQTPYYYNSQCLRSCPSGYLPNLQAYKCQPCASNCGSCTKTITTCTSCHETSTNTLLYNNQCVAECPPLISVQVGTACLPCSHACKTCAGDPNTCVTCASNKKFDAVGQTCLDQCKPQTQIYNPDLETCDPCNKTCSKCDGNVNKCTECKPGYVLNKDFTCQPTCNDENLPVHQTGVNGVCMDCEQPCNTCNKKTNYCTSCLQTPIKFYWYLQSQCVQYCPNKYNVTADGLSCFYVGLKCPQFFKLDATGDGCVPEQVECIEGYELNDQKTACIPLPGSPVPFPFLIAAVFVSFLVLGSYIKEKFYTKVYTCLIAIIGSFELLMYVLIVAFSYHMQEFAIAVIASVGTIALVTANILFVVYYQREILAADTTYSKWLYFFPKTRGLIVPCCLVNFKCAKILYSGFYGLESSMAQFGRPLEFYRIVRMVTYFAYIFAYVFIFIADFVIFARIKWGYQLLVLGIETFILQIVIIVLTYLEWKKDPQQLLSVGSIQYTTIKPKKVNEVNVKSALEDSEDDDYELGIPDVDEMILIRSKEKHHQLEVQLRMLAFQNLIKNAYVHQTELTKLQSKFDPGELSRRRAYSLTLDETDGWACENESSLFERRRRYSWPLTLEQPTEEDTAKFVVQIKDIEKADNEYLIDNCYFDMRPEPLPQQEQKPKKFASKRTQTYLRELLQLDGFNQNDSLQSIILDEDAEIDEDYCKGLLGHVLSHVSGNEAQSDFEEQLHASFHFMEADFDLAQLLGDFETDDLGNYVIVRKAGTNVLLDKQGRRVNRRGYLIDANGNVINTKGHIIFKYYELDQDDELPTKFDQALLHKREKMQIQGESAPVEMELNQYQETEREILKVESQSSIEVISDHEQIDKVVEEITTEKILKKQSQMKRPSHQIANNYPPKRFGHQYQGPLYPFIEIDNEEQRKLVNLTHQIGKQTQQFQQIVPTEPDLGQRVQQQKNHTLNELMTERQRASSVHDLSTKRPLTASRRAKPPLDKSNLSKIYSNIDQLVGLDEPQLHQVQELRPDTKRKSIQDSQRLAAVESIYLNKNAHRAVTAKGSRPQRPTLLQFEDNPVALNVETHMNGTKFNGPKARDVSLQMAERVDQIQRNYMRQMQSQDNLSEYQLILTERQKPNTAVRHDNWLQ